MIRRQIEILVRWAAFLVGFAVVGGIAAYWYADRQAPTYAAEARLAVRPGPNPDLNAILVSQQLATQYATAASNRSFGEAVQARLGTDVSVDDLLGAISARAESGSNVIILTARQGTAEAASTLANAGAEALMESLGTPQDANSSMTQRLLQTLDEEITAVQDRIEALQGLASPSAEQQLELQRLIDRRLQLQSDYTALLPYASQGRAGEVELLEQAIPPRSPTGFRPPIYALLGVIAGLLVAAAIAFVVEYADDTIRGPRDLQGLEATYLGGIRRRRRERVRDRRGIALLRAPRSAVASSYRNLRATLDLATGSPSTRCVLVTSTPSSVGKALTAANLALAYAETGRRVVLIDADMDSPQLHRMFGVVNGRGFAQLLAYARGLDDLAISELPQRNLRLVTAGLPDNDRPIAIAEARLRSVIESIRRECDIIVIDGPALEDDLHPTLALAAVADRTVLVATRGVSHLAQLTSAVGHLALVCGDALGLVLYGASSSFDYVAVPKAETPMVDGVYVE